MYTILVADDNRNIREFCRRELERCGYRVLVAEDGRETLEICELGFPDVVVLDLHMPGLDGIETIRRLRSRHPTLPIILHTAHREAIALESLPARSCVEKSESLQDLKQAIHGALAQG
jgi:CheY-like chemotaxis protein